MRIAIACIVVASTAVAHAESWGYDWKCVGPCAPGQLEVSGHEAGYASEGSCERARNEKTLEVNSNGSAGSTTNCVDSDPATPGSRSGVGRAVRAARLSRAYFALDGGRGYEATYAGGRVEQGASQFGAQVEVMFGRDEFGLGIEAGLRRDAGTPPVTGVAASPMWFGDLGFGLASSPFAFVKRPSFEVRPDLGAFYIWAIRTACDRCDVNILDPQPVEPNQGNTFRLRAGLDFYWGAQRDHGIALDALVQFGTLGDIAMGADEPTSVELRPPRLLFRLSYVLRPVW